MSRFKGFFIDPILIDQTQHATIRNRLRWSPIGIGIIGKRCVKSQRAVGLS